MSNKNNIVAVNTIIRNSDKTKVLLVKRKEDEIAYGGFWAFPGGKIENGETVFEALNREAIEEVGLELQQGYKKFISDFNFVRKDGFNVVGLVFEVLALSSDVVLDKDFDDFRWVSFEDAKKMKLIKGMIKELEIVFEK